MSKIVVRNIVGILSATRHGDEMGGSEGKRWIIEILSHLKIAFFSYFINLLYIKYIFCTC